MHLSSSKAPDDPKANRSKEGTELLLLDANLAGTTRSGLRCIRPLPVLCVTFSRNQWKKKGRVPLLRVCRPHRMSMERIKRHFESEDAVIDTEIDTRMGPGSVSDAAFKLSCVHRVDPSQHDEFVVNSFFRTPTMIEPLQTLHGQVICLLRFFLVLRFPVVFTIPVCVMCTMPHLASLCCLTCQTLVRSVETRWCSWSCAESPK